MMTHQHRKMSFEHSLDLSRLVERDVANWLRSKGWHILPAYDFSGKDDNKAPRLLAKEQHGSLVVPDLLACKDGSRWVEVKYKDHADYTWKTKSYDTGLCLRHWEHYQEVQKISNIDVWIVFVHRAEGEMRGASIDELAKLPLRTYWGDRMGRHGMVFFQWGELPLLASIGEILSLPTLAALGVTL